MSEAPIETLPPAYVELLEKEVERLRTVLEWYADQENYDENGAPVANEDGNMSCDFGERAMKALG